MRFVNFIFMALVIFVLNIGLAQATSHGNKNVMSSKVKGVLYIMNETHMTAYIYAKDDSGASNCYKECAENWPPIILPANAEMPENYTLIERKDGSMQVAYKNQPLYLWQKDKNIGDMKGDGIGGVWRLARP